MKPIDYDRLAKDYAQHRQAHPPVLEALVAACGTGPGCKVLEVGCGTGLYIGELAARRGVSGVGLDPSEEMLATARATTSRKIHYFKGRGEDLSRWRDRFDLIFSVDVIHHLQNPLEHFLSAFAALKPGGRLGVATDSAEIIRRRVLTRYFPETELIELTRYHKIGVLRLNLKAAGFINLQQETVRFDYPIADLGAYREKAFSALHLIPDHAFKQGLERMKQDLARGPIKATSRYLLLRADKPEKA